MSYPEHLRTQVEEYLAQLRFSHEPGTEGLAEAMRYSLLAGGKRIRPVLALATASALGRTPTSVLPLAAALELIHTYSLIHDDLPAMDNDDLRRGKPTSHKVFGEAIAILAGDALLTRAFHLLCEVDEAAPAEAVRRRLRAAALLGEAAGTSGLIGGQVMDLQSEGRAVTADDLERLHRAKTGALLAACVMGPAALAPATPDDAQRLQRYARAVGLAFQVVDDVLDATEGAAQLGKTAGKDDAAQKATYVRVHGIDNARALAARLREEALSAAEPLGARGALLGALARMMVDRRA